MKLIANISLVAGLILTGNVVAEGHSSLNQCAAIDDDSDRLACFDKLTANIDSKPAVSKGSTNAIAAATKDSQPKDNQTATQIASTQSEMDGKAVQTQNFGLESRQASGKEVDEISSAVVKIDKNPRGKLIITLANGMVWQQKGDDYFRAEVDDNATIERGLFGVFYLGVEGINRRVKVERLQ